MYNVLYTPYHCAIFITVEEDVVNSILFLLSEQSSMLNGVTLPVDGGQLVQ